MKYLVYIGNKLQSKGNTVTTIDTLGKQLETLGFQLSYASTKKNIVLRLFDMLWTVYKHRKQADYILIDTYSTLNFYYAFAVSKLCRILGLKYIPILHGGNLPNRLQNNPKLSALIFKNAYKNVSPSKYIQHHFKLKQLDCMVIPNSIDLHLYKFKNRSPISSIHLLWVRSFASIYNPKLAVDVLNALKLKGINASLCMVGPEKDGSLKDTKLYANKIGVEVTFTGGLSKKDWIALSKDYNVFINTTNFDNMPVSVIEAMALGLPVVSTNVGGLPYLIDNNTDGLLVQEKTVEPFVNAIINLKENQALIDNLTLNARKKAESFGWETVKKQWMDLLN